MNTRRFPGLPAPVPVCGFGSWAIGGRAYGPMSRETAMGTLRRFLDLGGVFIDTAEGYGYSEEVIGDTLVETGTRDRVVLATKTRNCESAAIRQSLEQSLRRLRTDRIDIYQIHFPPEEPEAMDTVLTAYEALQAEGKIRLIGASIKGPSVTDATVDLCRTYLRTGRVQALQVIYSVLRPRNAAMFAEAATAGVGIIARTVLENGFLAGRYAPGHEFPAGDHRNRWTPERRDRLLTAASRIAGDLPEGGESVAELALRFALTPPEVSVIIPGGKTPEQVEQNWRAASRPPLTDEVCARLRREFATMQDDANPDRTARR